MEKLMMSDLRPQSLVALDNSIWPDADYLALALILENNGSSIRVLPVHNDLAKAGGDDVIVAPEDSGLDFTIVVVGQQPFSLPVTAFSGTSRRICEELFVWMKSERSVPYSKCSGSGVEQIHGSSAIRWRQGFINAFEKFRLNCWKREFISTGEEAATRQALPSLAAILDSLQSQRQGGVLADKSSKLSIGKRDQGDLATTASKLCRDMGCEENQISQLEKMSEADIFELLTNILKK